MVQRKKRTKPKLTLNDGPFLKVLCNLSALFTLFYSPLQPYLHPLISSSLLRRLYMTIWSPLRLVFPSIPSAPARVFIFAQPTAQCLTRWKELGVKRRHCCQLWSLPPSLSLSSSLAVTVDIFQLMYSGPLVPPHSVFIKRKKKKAAHIFIINFVKYTRSGVGATFSGANGRYLFSYRENNSFFLNFIKFFSLTVSSF